MDRNDHLHALDLIGETVCDVADRDSVYFLLLMKYQIRVL